MGSKLGIGFTSIVAVVFWSFLGELWGEQAGLRCPKMALSKETNIDLGDEAKEEKDKSDENSSSGLICLLM